MSDARDWLQKQENYSQWKDKFEADGYLVVENLLGEIELERYRCLCDDLISGRIDASSHRHDLGSHLERKNKKNENICQIMWPSHFVDNLLQSVLHSRAHQIAQLLLGEDMDFDFDMIICKASHTDTVTPMHQDESYWLDMPDKRAVSVWVALDDAIKDNGCMWFGPGSHLRDLRQHQPAASGHHVLCCQGDESELVAAPIKAGSCTLHHGRTIHYTRGNKTDRQRRAFIVNFRPKQMVKWERDHGFDHGKSKGINDILEDDKRVDGTLSGEAHRYYTLPKGDLKEIVI